MREHAVEVMPETAITATLLKIPSEASAVGEQDAHPDREEKNACPDAAARRIFRDSPPSGAVSLPRRR
ncbi:hypothetical protein [Methanoculleus caldifontis]|uniref:hypothetical protein n=1 Tax=Methanoculleus caldifontis TaxID=2651577 RepID=UPI002936F347|nr:hypothetical protein [Methanoculleus sp. Wushi-C6]